MITLHSLFNLNTMASKSKILNNLREFTSDQIVEAINAGTVTMYELSKSGNLTPLMRRRIEEKLAAKPEEVSQPALDVAPTKPEVAPTLNEDALALELVKKETTSTSSSTEISNKGMFKRPFSFHGRIRRLEYGLSVIIYVTWNVIAQVLMDVTNSSVGASLFVLLSFIPLVWFLWAQNCKRCHDRGNSGWYQLIPFYGFVLLFGGGEKGSNNYGGNPKE